MEGVHKPGILPCICDCSAFVTYCYSWAGAPDPNGQNYDGQGYTGTLLAHGTEIPKASAVGGDLIVYGAGTGDHVAMIVEAGSDPLTVSMGQQGDPNYVRVSQDGRQPQRFLRYSTTSSTPAPAPAPAPTPTPTPGGVTMVPLPILKTGSTGGNVKSLQRLLAAHQTLSVDGQFGPATDKAVRNWQTVAKIGVDGIVGAQTWSTLIAGG
jgi:hypothetical protein